MKIKSKGFVVFLSIILVTSGITISLPGILPSDDIFTSTGTPSDNFPDAQREQLCGVGNAKSTFFVTEYKIPTNCVQPLAITVDPQDDIWFTETNTGMIAKFNPDSESFIEYDNSLWPDGAHSMMWGLSYFHDDSFWFTDETFSSIWKFSIFDQSYKSIQYPVGDQSSPHEIKSVNSNLIVSEYSNGFVSFFSPTDTSASFFNIPQILPNSVVQDFTVDNKGNLW